MSGEGKPETSGDTKEQTINLRVKSNDGASVHFRVKRSTQLKKLMTAYCERQGMSLNTVRFLYDGERVQNEDTPNSLQMDDDEIIEVFQEQVGGGFRQTL
eukprot:Clim_evm159s157 gene=Clim_evmTU159s157